jgi:hypothetical protein
MSWIIFPDVVGSLFQGERLGAPKTHANINNLIGFLDAFKAAPPIWRDCGVWLWSGRPAPSLSARMAGIYRMAPVVGRH